MLGTPGYIELYKGTSLRIARAPWHDNLCGDPFGHVGGTWAAQCWSFQHCIFSEEVYYQRGLQCFLWRLSMVVGARHRYVIEYVSLLTTISHTATVYFCPAVQYVSMFTASRTCGGDYRHAVAKPPHTPLLHLRRRTALHCTVLHCSAFFLVHRIACQGTPSLQVHLQSEV